MFEITVAASFHAAHAIRLPDGSLEPLHAHDWNLRVTVGADRLDAIETVMDFHQLQALLANAIDPWRHGCLNELAPFAAGNINPTAERVAWCISQAVAPHLPASVTLLSVQVEEAPGCFATYRPTAVDSFTPSELDATGPTSLGRGKRRAPARPTTRRQSPPPSAPSR